MRRQRWFRIVAGTLACLLTLAMGATAWLMPHSMPGVHGTVAAMHCAADAAHHQPAPGHEHDGSRMPPGCIGLCCICVFPALQPSKVALLAQRVRETSPAAPLLRGVSPRRRLPHVLHFANGPPVA